MTRRTSAALVVLFTAGLAGAAAASPGEEKAAPAPSRVTQGEYVELDENGTLNPLLVMRVAEVSPNIVAVRGANGWVAFASYDEAAKEYRGFFEWQTFGPQRSPAGKWADLFQIRLTRTEGGRILMTGKSKGNEFTIRAAAKP